MEAELHNNEDAPQDDGDSSVQAGNPTGTIQWPIRRFKKSGEESVLQDRVVREQRIELILNGVPLLAMLALPHDVEAMVLGFLVSEGLCKSRDQIPEISFDPAKGQVRCSGSFEDEAVENIHHRWTFGTGCGGGGTARDPSRLEQCRPINNQLTISASKLIALGREFSRRGFLYRTTGGVHACAIADSNQLLLFAEDVGRHNAFDKVVGLALMQGVELANKIALTTGRLSAEIVAKAIANELPILASFSAPTAMGAQWARRFGLTLVGFLRGQRFNVYTGYQRFVNGREGD